MSMNAEREIGTGPGEASSDPLLQGRRILVTGASGFIGAHLYRILRGETPSLSSGRRPVDWIYADDVVEAFMAVARSTAGGGRIFEIGSGSLLTVRDLVERLASLVRQDARLDFDTASGRPLKQVRVADIRRSAEVLFWTPKVSIDEGLRCTVGWYRRFFKPSAVKP